jgi:hypothetical protein
MALMIDAITLIQVGAAGGAIGLAGVAVLAALYFGHRRQVRSLMRWTATQPRRQEPTGAESRTHAARWGPQRWAAALTAVLVVVGVLKLALNDPSNAGPGTAGRGVRPLAAAAVRVVNAAGIPGLAERAAARLKAGGLQVAAVGDATPRQAVSTVLYDPDDRRAATAAADLLRIGGQPRLSPAKPAPGTDVLVVLGRDAG